MKDSQKWSGMFVTSICGLYDEERDAAIASSTVYTKFGEIGVNK
jgi:hypothetical protein